MIDCYSVKPIDGATLARGRRATGRIVTVEDHWPEGGLGEAVLARAGRAGGCRPGDALAVARHAALRASRTSCLAAFGIDADRDRASGPAHLQLARNREPSRRMAVVIGPTCARSSPAGCSSTASRSRSSGASGSPSPGRTAPARRRCSGCSPARPGRRRAARPRQGHAGRAARPAAAARARPVAARVRALGRARPGRARGGAARLESAMAAGDHERRRCARYSEAQARLEHAGGYAWRENVAGGRARPRVRGRPSSTGSWTRSPAAS